MEATPPPAEDQFDTLDIDGQEYKLTKAQLKHWARVGVKEQAEKERLKTESKKEPVVEDSDDEPIVKISKKLEKLEKTLEDERESRKREKETEAQLKVWNNNINNVLKNYDFEDDTVEMIQEQVYSKLALDARQSVKDLTKSIAERFKAKVGDEKKKKVQEKLADRERARIEHNRGNSGSSEKQYKAEDILNGTARKGLMELLRERG